MYRSLASIPTLVALFHSIAAAPTTSSCPSTSDIFNINTFSAVFTNAPAPLPLPGTYPPISLVFSSGPTAKSLALTNAVRVLDKAIDSINALRPFEILEPVPGCGAEYEVDSGAFGLRVDNSGPGRVEQGRFTWDVLGQAIKGYKDFLTLQGKESVGVRLVRIQEGEGRQKTYGYMRLEDGNGELKVE